jgi:hypothetical protein
MSRTLWSQILIVGGLLGMLVGAADPLEGAFVILPSSGAAALGVLLGRSRYRTLLCGSFALIVVGVGVMVLFTAIGGIGGSSGRSLWWAIFILPYPIGWLAGIIGATLSLLERFKQPPPQSRQRH